MNPIFKITPLVILAIAFLGAFLLGTSAAQASIAPILAEYTPESVTALISAWGQVIFVALGMIAAIVVAVIGYVRTIQKKLSEKIDEKIEERKAATAEHHEQLAQLNAIQPTPLPTIQAPTNPPTP